MWFAHVVGGAVGGAVMAGATWILASPLRTLPPRDAAASLFACAVAFFAAWDVVRFRLPFRGRQVPATWRSTYGATRSYGMYGAFLGTGLLTYVPVGATYVLFCGIALMNGLFVATVAGALYGVARAALIGPAALAAEASSKLLFRSRMSHTALHTVSAGASVALLVQAVRL